ncbi:MAG TPA: FG-GAP-like repeat-containing protein, partial [Ignavibacteriaceae bacterium]|nr:FG-GAP-like repeat-containing protein [Ignavibacteriaceae bacterium]
MKKVFIVLLLTTITINAQNPVVLQPWMQVEGTYNGQKLGSSVGFAGKIGDSTIITASDVNGINMYHIKTPDNTVPRFFFPGVDCSLGDFNGDGIQDLLANGNPTKIYLGISEGVFDTIPFFVKHQEPDGDTFGRRVAIGKINGDLFDDLVITDDFYPNGLGNGRVYIFFGGIDMDTIPNFLLDGYIRSRLGFNITTGDLNNDGYDDIIVKGRDFNAPTSLDRFPYIKIFLGGNTIDTTAWKYLKGTRTNSFGLSCFDVNGDGVKDLLWTNYSSTDSMNSVYIHYSVNNDVDTLPSLILLNSWAQNVTNAGDMNGDGYDDILISSNGSDAGGNSYIFVYSGGPNMDTHFDAAVGIGGVSNLGAFGSIAGIGDVNGDGLDDILVGAYTYQWFTERGKWFIFLGDSSIPVTSIKDDEFSLPSDFILFQNHPNPFNPKTVISWQSSVFSHTTIKIFDILGKEIATLVDEEKPAGKYEVEFNAGNLSSGVYFYTITLITSDGKKQTTTKKMILLSELEWKQEEEYEKQLLEMTIKGNKAAQVELSERMMSKTSPQLRKYIL